MAISRNSKYSCEERERLGVSDELTAWVAQQRKDYRYFQGTGGKKLKDKPGLNSNIDVVIHRFYVVRPRGAGAMILQST